MTDLISHFTIEATKNASNIMKVVGLLRGVDNVIMTVKHGILVVLESPMKDDDDQFGQIKKAVLTLNGVIGIRAYETNFGVPSYSIDVAEKVLDSIADLKPAKIIAEADMERYASECRAWKRASAMIGEAAINAMKT